jgi:hypothetical protein
MRCRINTATVETPSGPSEQSLLTILGECETTAADLTNTREPGELEDATEFLKELLVDGEWHERRQVKASAEARHLAWRTVERAKKVLGVEHKREGFPGVTSWRLSVPPTTVPPPMAQLGWRDCENGSTEPYTADPSPSPASSPANGAPETIKLPKTAPATVGEEALLARLTTLYTEADGERP